MKDVYHRLQKHLNRQPVGFPATKSGSEIRILKCVFSPSEAEPCKVTNRKETCLAIGSAAQSISLTGYDIIMANKKGIFGKLAISGKLVFDAIRTGQLHLLSG